MRSIFTALAGFALLLPLPAVAQDAASPDDPVAYATSAAPSYVSDDATVIDMEGNVLKEGTNGWTCVPGRNRPMCLDEAWMSWLDAFMDQRDQVDINLLGLAYMLQGDGGASNIDPYAEGPTPDNQWVQTGPHLMVIVPDPALLEDIPTDPAAGEPYVMWKDTPFAHVMVPVDEEGTHLPR